MSHFELNSSLHFEASLNVIRRHGHLTSRLPKSMQQLPYWIISSDLMYFEIVDLSI